MAVVGSCSAGGEAESVCKESSYLQIRVLVLDSKMTNGHISNRKIPFCGGRGDIYLGSNRITHWPLPKNCSFLQLS